MDAIAIADTPALSSSSEPADLTRTVRQFNRRARAKNTNTAYHSDMTIFANWCQPRGLRAIPAEPNVVAAFVADQACAGIRPVTLNRRIAAIRATHRALNLPDPTADSIVRDALASARNQFGIAGKPKAPLMAAAVRSIAEGLSRRAGPAIVRDRAILLLGFAAAMRRSEIVSLTPADIEFVPEGLKVTIRKSKTDQVGAGQTVAVPFGSSPATCPVAALKAWMALCTPMGPDGSTCTPVGPLFRRIFKGGRIAPESLTPYAVALSVKARAREMGYDPIRLAAHSLRSGFVTSAFNAGASVPKVMATTRHRSTGTVMRYSRDADLFRNNAAAGLL